MKGTVLVTGATGFVGRHLVPALIGAGYAVRACRRSAAPAPFATAASVLLGDLRGPVDWAALLGGVDLVVHLAGIAHTRGVEPGLHDAVNHRATATLAAAAAATGVCRLVFVSSILAQSEASALTTLNERDAPAPVGAYGVSKLAAERALAGLTLDHVILRPVLVFGAGVRGNMAQLLRLAALPLPLPLGAVHNRRSLVAVEDLVGAVLMALEAPGASRQTFLVADDAPVSLAQMIAALRAGRGRRSGLLPVSSGLLSGLARLTGQGAAWQRAAGDLVASNAKLRDLGWVPQHETLAGLRRLAAGDGHGSGRIIA